MKKRVSLLLCLMLVLSLTGCKKEEAAPEVPLLSPVTAAIDAAPVMRADISSLTILNGEVMTAVEELSFDVDGFLYQVFVSPGDHVNEGDALAGITGPDYQTIKNLEDELKTLEDDNNEEIELKEKELKIAKLKGQNTSYIELEIKQLKEKQELSLKQKKDRLEVLKANDIGYIYITAPYETTVIATTSKSGYITAGTPVVALAAEGDPIITSEYVSERSLNKAYEYYALVHGEKVELEFIPYNRDMMKELTINEEVPTACFKIKSGDMSKIIPGDYAAVFVVESYKPDVVTVPVNAVFTDTNGRYVYEIVDNARVRRQVELGVSDLVNIEILNGVEEGAYVFVKN